MISKIYIFWLPFWIFVGQFVFIRIFVLFLKWCYNNTLSPPVGPKFRSFLASDARFPRYGGLKFRNVLSVGKIRPSTPECSGAIGWIAYKSHSRLPPYPRIITLTYPVHRFKTRREMAFSKSRKIIISRKIQRENNSLGRGNSVQTNKLRSKKNYPRSWNGALFIGIWPFGSKFNTLWAPEEIWGFFKNVSHFGFLIFVQEPLLEWCSAKFITLWVKISLLFGLRRTVFEIWQFEKFGFFSKLTTASDVLIGSWPTAMPKYKTDKRRWFYFGFLIWPYHVNMFID